MFGHNGFYQYQAQQQLQQGQPQMYPVTTGTPVDPYSPFQRGHWPHSNPTSCQDPWSSSGESSNQGWNALHIKHDSNSSTGASSTPSSLSSEKPDDFRLASLLPGVEFDPTTRRFSDDELRPLPIMRKRKKQFVPDEQKDDKYWSKRRKNNEAAKLSREAKRMKENQIIMRAAFLENENSGLRKVVKKYNDHNDELRNDVVQLNKRLTKFEPL